MNSFQCLARDIYRLEVPFPGCWTGVVLVRGEENILIDSGSCAETVDSCIVPALKELGLTLKDIGWMAMTHIHGDHVGGCARLRALAPGLKLAVYEPSAQRMREPRKYSAQIRARFQEHAALIPPVLEGLEPDLLLKDGEALCSLRLIHTPGHDTDSCCYLDTRTQTLITGDSLQLNGTVSQGCALVMDAKGYEETITMLLEMDLSNLICGHPYLPLGAEAVGRKQVRAYLDKCLACAAHDEGFVHGMMAAGISDAVFIAKALLREAGSVEPAHLFLPLYTVSQYMGKGDNAI